MHYIGLLNIFSNTNHEYNWHITIGMFYNNCKTCFYSFKHKICPFWLFFCFKIKKCHIFEHVYYCMFINAADHSEYDVLKFQIVELICVVVFPDEPVSQANNGRSFYKQEHLLRVES